MPILIIIFILKVNYYNLYLKHLYIAIIIIKYYYYFLKQNLALIVTVIKLFNLKEVAIYNNLIKIKLWAKLSLNFMVFIIIIIQIAFINITNHLSRITNYLGNLCLIILLNNFIIQLEFYYIFNLKN